MFNQYYTFKLLPWLAMVCDLVSIVRLWWRNDSSRNLQCNGAVWPNGERTTFNAIYLAQNIGVATGGNGWFRSELSFNYIFLANLIMYVLFGIVAITQFNLEYHAKIRTPDDLDIHSKENKNALLHSYYYV